MADRVRRRLRTVVGATVLAELGVFIAVAAWIGLAWTIVATVLTSVLGGVLLARQGRRALLDLRERARTRQGPGRELGDAGLVAVGGLLMVLPGFIGDLIGLLCLVPGPRGLVRRALTRLVLSRLPAHVRGPVHVGSVRTGPAQPSGASASTGRPLVLEGEIVEDPVTDRPTR